MRVTKIEMLDDAGQVVEDCEATMGPFCEVEAADLAGRADATRPCGGQIYSWTTDTGMEHSLCQVHIDADDYCRFQGLVQSDKED
jgi:hypothetical protein